ncbi:TonB-dependent receptor [Pleionea sp. CnH1-48]|uniref:TonB-dependent siderophore receptor n=1 Tax=Pleionea sp. CnH1-48 TaxID=2954494 RepID=UPI002096EB43|nr:TonB-dependent receptor [Pleionea sp. CnH1-48]MCO7227479.1 TonB-dependent receptor [Pleionea sp. CnH1-48]
MRRLLSSLIQFGFGLALLASFSATAQNPPRYQFSIDEQPLHKAILEFAVTLNLEVVFLSELTEGQTSQSLTGEFTLKEALDILFAQTDLQANITTEYSIVIRRRPVTKPKLKPVKIYVPEKTSQVTEAPDDRVVRVVGKLISPYRLHATLSSTKTQRDFLETPQMVNALSDRLKQDTASRDYSELSQYASSVTFLERNAGVTNELRLRGFSYPALKIDGVSAHGYTSPPDLAFVDNLEVAKGPSSVLYGRMEPGGLINLLLKRPGESRSSIRLSSAEDGFQRLELNGDFSITEDWDLRAISFVQKDGERENFTLNDAEGFYLNTRYEWHDGASWNLRYRYEEQNAAQHFGSISSQVEREVELVSTPNGIALITPIDNDFLTTLALKKNNGHISLEDWLIGDWALQAHLQFERYESNSETLFPFIANFEFEYEGITYNRSNITDAQLNDADFLEAMNEAFAAFDPDIQTIDFESLILPNTSEFLSSEVILVNKTQIWGHSLEQLYGLNLSRSQPGQLVWQTHDNRGSFNAGINEQVVINNPDVPIDFTEDNIALFAQWVLSWGDNATWFIGARQDDFRIESQPPFQADQRSYSELSYRLGWVYRLNASSSVYANYSESFTPQFELIESNNGDQVTIRLPSPSYQWELGLKQLWLDERLQSSCALFEIKKENIISLINAQRNKGIECDLAGELAEDWQIILSGTYLRAEITESHASEIRSKTPRMTPEKTLQLWLNYKQQLSDSNHLFWGLGYRYVDERFADDENHFLFEPYHRMDASLRLQVNRRWELGVHIKNLWNQSYVDGVFNNFPFWVNEGQKRTLEVTAQYQFD